MPHRRELLVAGALATLMLPARALAHHGWAWAEDEEFTLAGVIRAAPGSATRTASSTSRRPTGCGSPRSASPGATPRPG